MSLNKFMHPRNPYRTRKPNFKQLAEKYEKFREHVTEDNAGVHIDFKKPECLRALTWALLKDDFDLDVSIPLDRLIPTVPLRLNYLLWIEDIMKSASDVQAIDIGAGASCVYGLLGARKNSWTFLSTETDATNFEYAKKNVADNGLEGRVTVVKVDEGTVLYDVLSDNDKKYDFCMCNPPFYGSNLEAWGMLTTRSDHRPDPSSVSTASPSECIVPGGEVDFVKRIIADSLTLRDRIRVYTTMFGKKSSIAVIKEDLKRNGVTNIGQTEFCQGRTMRWGLAWSFDETVVFPKAPSRQQKEDKRRAPLTYTIPRDCESLRGVAYTLQAVTDKVMALVDQLQIRHLNREYTETEREFDLIAKKNTWSHQRRKRRHQRQQGEGEQGGQSEVHTEQSDNSKQTHTVIGTETRHACTEDNTPDRDTQSDSAKRKLDKSVVCEDEGRSPKKSRLEQDDASRPPDANSGHCTDNVQEGVPNRTAQRNRNQSPDTSEPLLTCVLGIRLQENIVLDMQWVSGQNRESMHQIMQFIKNKLS